MTTPKIEFEAQGAIDSLTEISELWQQAKPDTTPKVVDTHQSQVLYKCPSCGGYGCGNRFAGLHLIEGNHKLGKKALRKQKAYALRDAEAIHNTQIWFKRAGLKERQAQFQNAIALMKAEINMMKGIGKDILNGRQIF